MVQNLDPKDLSKEGINFPNLWQQVESSMPAARRYASCVSASCAEGRVDDLPDYVRHGHARRPHSKLRHDVQALAK